MSEMEIIDTRWFTSLNTVGIVLTKTEFGHKTYIGMGVGLSEKADAEAIADHGANFHYGRLIWPSIKDWRE